MSATELINRARACYALAIKHARASRAAWAAGDRKTADYYANLNWEALMLAKEYQDRAIAAGWKL